jgi:uncharacterized protein with HEPN domain
MQAEGRDRALLWDMLSAARDVAEFVRGVTLQRFENERIVRYAVERQLLVIGEAAARVSQGFRDAHPGIPWPSIIGQRNVLAHDYGEVLVERVWLVAVERIPLLIEQLAGLVTEPPAAD